MICLLIGTFFLEDDDGAIEDQLGGDTDDEAIQQVIDIISHGTSDGISNAAAFLCHVTYQNSEVKGKVV